MSIYDNIAYGPRVHGEKNRARLDEIVERSLRQAAVWGEAKDRLQRPALAQAGRHAALTISSRNIVPGPSVLRFGKKTYSKWRAVLLGAGVTAVIQSSSATTVMVVGFVNSGMMKLSQAIGIIMGANVGTTESRPSG